MGPDSVFKARLSDGSLLKRWYLRIGWAVFDHPVLRLDSFYPEWRQSAESRYISAQHLQAATEPASWLAPPVDPACLLRFRIKADKWSPVTSINTHKENHSSTEMEREGSLWLFVWGSQGCSHLSPVLPSICWLARTRRWIDQDVDCCDCLVSVKRPVFPGFQTFSWNSDIQNCTRNEIHRYKKWCIKSPPTEKLFISFHSSFWPETSSFYSFIESCSGFHLTKKILSLIYDVFITKFKMKQDERF